MSPAPGVGEGRSAKCQFAARMHAIRPELL